ncbi:DUF1054 family protein [Alloscardovia criceti]|uniref:DUF1054 family protein n=1 Tax=Alloscardovia criceti TaxID=356828 RepID=UPI00036376C6|nr:DUF1054 family protein [Alloscardovia criceti]
MSFTARAFGVFDVEGLEPRMTAIRAELWPLFNTYGAAISQRVSDSLHLEEPLAVHIAQHLRRTTHAPESTWVAIGGDKRGYKKYPHFQIGINDEYVFIALACIDRPVHIVDIAQDFAQNGEDIRALSQDFVLIPDHTKKAFFRIQDVALEEFFARVAQVKSSEFMMGRLEKPGSPTLRSAKACKAWILSTVDELIPLYARAMSWYEA